MIVIKPTFSEGLKLENLISWVLIPSQDFSDQGFFKKHTFLGSGIPFFLPGKEGNTNYIIQSMHPQKSTWTSKCPHIFFSQKFHNFKPLIFKGQLLVLRSVSLQLLLDALKRYHMFLLIFRAPNWDYHHHHHHQRTEKLTMNIRVTS